MNHFFYTCELCGERFDNGYQFMANAVITCPDCMEGTPKTRVGDRLPLNQTPAQIKKWLSDYPNFGLVVDGDAMCLRVVKKGGSQ